MKKLMLVMLTLVLGGLAAMAGDKLEVISGSIASLKNSTDAAFVKLDMTNTTYDKKKPVRKDARFANIDNNMDDWTSEFVREFNENSKAFRLTDTDQNAAYKMVVDVEDLDYHVNVMSFKGGHAIELEGTVTISDNAGKEVAKLSFQHESSGFTFDIAIEETFEGLAKNLAKKIKKGK